MKKAIVSSYTKDDGLLNSAKKLVQCDYTVFSTGGTYRFLREAGIAVKELADLTGFDTLADQRVKTLSPVIYEAILSPSLREDHPLFGLKVVLVDLYPFPRAGEFEKHRELIDIGGVTLLRASAKNIPHVLPFLNSGDLIDFLDGVEISPESLSKKVFSFTSYYDSVIASSISASDLRIDHSAIALEKVCEASYGENPGERGEVFSFDPSGLCRLKVVTAKKGISFNNYYDAWIAYEAAGGRTKPAAAVVKHGNPVGAAFADSIEEAFEKAMSTDPVSAFGGIIALNREPDRELVLKLREHFMEVLIVPALSEECISLLFEKRKNLRIFIGEYAEGSPIISMRGFAGTLLVNSRIPAAANYKIVSECNSPAPSDHMIDFGISLLRLYTSNSILLIKNNCVIGAGFGFPNRIEAMQRAILQAGDAAEGAMLLSDGFFPFADSIEIAAEAKIGWIIQPGGSLKDKKVIKRAKELGIGMMLTGERYFRH
ncbi:hypothetical protein KAI78_06420 [bacterium]|nr:hypothetical protein [bacterium]